MWIKNTGLSTKEILPPVHLQDCFNFYWSEMWTENHYVEYNTTREYLNDITKLTETVNETDCLPYECFLQRLYIQVNNHSFLGGRVGMLVFSFIFKWQLWMLLSIWSDDPLSHQNKQKHSPLHLFSALNQTQPKLMSSLGFTLTVCTSKIT